MEGSECYNPATDCSQSGLVLPIGEYDHTLGFSITGGFVYRGVQIPDLYGKYIFGDYVTARVWILTPNGDGTWAQSQLTQLTGINISSFGEDNEGELYLVDYSGNIYLIKDANPQKIPNAPMNLRSP